MLKCGVCGKFISYAAIEQKQAKHTVEPDNHFAPETSETLCELHNNNFVADLATNALTETDRVGG